MEFEIGVLYENLSRKFEFYQNLTIARALHEDQYTFSVISRSVLLRMKNVSDKSCRETRNTHFMFSNVFYKIFLFMR
jgi:hypothetical protein